MNINRAPPFHPQTYRQTHVRACLPPPPAPHTRTTQRRTHTRSSTHTHTHTHTRTHAHARTTHTHTHTLYWLIGVKDSVAYLTEIDLAETKPAVCILNYPLPPPSPPPTFFFFFLFFFLSFSILLTDWGSFCHRSKRRGRYTFGTCKTWSSQFSWVFSAAATPT